jgi:hypothetical protein
VAALRPAAVVYREEQNFDWRVYALLALGEVLVWVCVVCYWDGASKPFWGVPLPLVVAAGLLLLGVVVIGVLRMTIEATPSQLRVWFGWVPIYRREIAVASLRRVEIVTYRPFLDHGGWGIRTSRDGDRILTARGTRGVRVELIDGTRLLIGSQRSEELAAALERAIRSSH